jgi:hypothetical protein
VSEGIEARVLGCLVIFLIEPFLRFYWGSGLPSLGRGCTQFSMKATAKAITSHMPTADHAFTPANREAIPPIHNTITIIVSSRLGDGSPLCPPVLVRLPNTAPAEYPANVKKIKANQLRVFIDLFSFFSFSGLFGLSGFSGLSGLSGLFSLFSLFGFFGFVEFSVRFA